MYTATRRAGKKPPIQKERVGWPNGYMSTAQDGTIPETALADMTNYDLSTNSLPFIRQSLVPYGADFLGTCIGVGTFRKTITGGVQENWEVSTQVTAVNAVQTLSITGSPTGGTFTLTFGGHTTSTINWNASASAVQTALQALSSIGTGNVTCTGGALPTTAVVITFTGTLADTNVSTITIGTNSLTGGTSPAPHIAATTTGGPTGKLYTRKDGDTWTLISGSYGYDNAAWSSYCQAHGRAYIINGVNNLSYYDIVSGAVVTYTQISKPAAPTVTQTGLTGSTYTLYYVITATTEAGETDGSVEGTVTVSALRDAWDGSTQYVDLSFTLPSGSNGGKVYVGTAAGQEQLIATVNAGATSYRDYGKAASVTLRPPISNSTGGPILVYLTNITGQLFGIDVDGKVWYDGGSAGTSGNFTIAGGGGWVAIDDSGPTIPMAVVGYPTGKGDPVPTVVCNAAGALGAVRQITFTPQQIGDLSALMPNVSDANGSVGTVAPFATVVADNSIHFPTGNGFGYEGHAANIPNILTPNSTSDFIQKDCDQLLLAGARGWRALVYQNRVYFAVSRQSNTNNEVWILDLRTNPARWIMPWTIAAQHMWLYEDNDHVIHFCMLVDGTEMELSDKQFTTDGNTSFSTHVASGPVKWDSAGLSVGYVQNQRFRLNNVRGDAIVAVNGTTEMPNRTTIEIDQGAPGTFSGWGDAVWGVDDWGSEPSTPATILPGTLVATVPMKTKLNGFSWEITTTTSGCALGLGGVDTEGVMIPRLYAG